VSEVAKGMYERREKMLGEAKMRQIETIIMLSVIDANWKDYLFNIDQLREGINWRAYGQMDPLVEYQHEAFSMFTDLIKTIDEEIIENVFKAHAVEERFSRAVFKKDKEVFIKQEYSALSDTANIASELPPQAADFSQTKPAQAVKVEGKKVGRNDPCPCGSGKKFKKCCGR
jgi:preprotein translocase subunit SecA